MKNLFRLLLAVSLLQTAHASTSSAPTDEIVLWVRNYERTAFLELIDLAARLSADKYGPYTIKPSLEMEQGRAFNSLHTGKYMNVAISGISVLRESQGIPIYIPVDRGLLGFRKCLLHKDTPNLTTLHPMQDLTQKKILVGAGTHWPDRQILEYNGLTVVHSPIYKDLFRMLNAKRFECFLRSVNEIKQELRLFADFNFNVDPEVAFVYPQGDFIFVSAAQPRIHERLQYGLKIAIESGEFQEYFDKYFARNLSSLKFYESKIIYLDNRDLSISALDAINRYGIASFSVSAYLNPSK